MRGATQLAVSREGEPRTRRGSIELESADAPRARALGAGLDLERNLLATHEGVEVAVGAALVEEELLPVLCGDESKSALRNDLLDGASRHLVLHFSRTKATHLGPVREIGACGERRPLPAGPLYGRALLGTNRGHVTAWGASPNVVRA